MLLGVGGMWDDCLSPPHPTFDAPSVREPGLTEIFELFYPLFVQGGGPEFTGISNQHELLYLSVSPFFGPFDM